MTRLVVTVTTSEGARLSDSLTVPDATAPSHLEHLALELFEAIQADHQMYREEDAPPVDYAYTYEVLPTLYRYDVQVWDRRVSIHLETYQAVKATPCGWWFTHPWDTERRWVSATARKRFCYPTPELAWESFCIRKRRHLAHLRAKVNTITALVDLIERHETPPLPRQGARRGLLHDPTATDAITHVTPIAVPATLKSATLSY